MKKLGFGILTLTLGLAAAGHASASSFTNGTLPVPPVTPVGGIVLDLVGLNGNRVITEAAASTLFIGDAPSFNPLTIGSQGGFNASVITALGGGLASASARVSLYDGDSQVGNFDYNDNTLLIGNTFASSVSFGNFSNVTTQQTDGLGNALGSLTMGFGDNILDTGFFSLNGAASLAAFYGELTAAAAGTGQVTFYLNDVDPGDQYYDFTQGIDGSLVNVGTGPIITPPPIGTVPLPASFPMFGGAVAALGIAAYGAKRRKAASAA